VDLSSYLRRIGFVGDPRPDLATLCQIQRGHMTHIPYENLDVQLGRRLTVSPEEAFDKLVTRRRGGWCYEMNGLLRWALETVGFEVLPMTGAIRRDERGDSALGNHLALTVRLDRDYLVEAGLGDGPWEPVPLEEGVHREQWRDLRLERIDGGWWRFRNYENSFAASFDFQHQPVDWKVLEQKCNWLQTSPDSVFVQNAVCVRPSATGFTMLVGRVLKTIAKDETTNRTVNSAKEYGDLLASMFGLELPEAGALWPAIVRRHEALFGS
jgi:N-hydroxyarylamine O-acetyltransferase